MEETSVSLKRQYTFEIEFGNEVGPKIPTPRQDP